MSTPGQTLRAALEDASREGSVSLGGGWVELGRPLFASPVAPSTGAASGASEAAVALAWGTVSDEERARWIASVRPGAVLAQVFSRERPGARGMLDRVLLLPARERPLPLEDVCTALFLHGVRGLRVIELEARRNVVAVIGRRTA